MVEPAALGAASTWTRASTFTRFTCCTAVLSMPSMSTLTKAGNTGGEDMAEALRLLHRRAKNWSPLKEDPVACLMRSVRCGCRLTGHLIRHKLKKRVHQF